MNPNDAALAALQEALNISPDNQPLRQHYAMLLLQAGRGEEAEREFRKILAVTPDNAGVKASLAQAFYQQGKGSEALVLVESLIKQPPVAPASHLLYARLLLGQGAMAQASDHYRQAVAADPMLADAELANRLSSAAQAARQRREADEDESDDDTPPRQAVPVDDRDDEPVEGEIEKPKVNFKDVGGMESVKEEIRMKIIHPLTHPELYQAFGKKIGGGMLMYGPPGCGKTHLARATAGEISARFMSVGISDVLDMWVGSSERNLHALFEQARRVKPCVLFFDEVDALAASRSDMRHSGGRHLINQFLNEMDGLAADNDGLLILAATNAPWHVDSAFRRPGRFDRILFVPPPDAPARASIVRLLTTGKPTRDLDFESVAAKTDAFSGADLKSVVDIAIEGKIAEAMKAGSPTPLTTKDLMAAVKRVKPSTREWFAAAKNYAMYSNQGGVYDDILKYLKM